MPDPRIDRLGRQPGRRRAEDAEAIFWEMVEDAWFGSEAATMPEGQRNDLLTVAEETAWRMQFGGVGRKEAFTEALHARGCDLPSDFGEWLIVMGA